MTNDLVQHSQTSLSPADINSSGTITGGYKRRRRSRPISPIEKQPER